MGKFGLGPVKDWFLEQIMVEPDCLLCDLPIPHDDEAQKIHDMIAADDCWQVALHD